MPRWVRFALPVAVLSVIVALVSAAHGFDPYLARVTYLQPGDTVTVGGVLEFAPSEAVATRDESRGVWRIVVYGTCRNISDASLLDYRFAQNALRTFDPATRTFGQADDRSLWFGGAGNTYTGRLNPGLPTEWCRLGDELAGTLETLPGHLGVAVFEVSSQDLTSSKIGDTAWIVTGTHVWLYFVPLTIGS